MRLDLARIRVEELRLHVRITETEPTQYEGTVQDAQKLYDLGLD